MHAGTGINHRPLGTAQQIRRPPHIIGRRRITRGQHRLINQFAWKLLGEHIGGDLHQHRPTPAIAQPREGAAHDIRHLGRQRHRLSALGDARHLHGGGKIRLDLRNTPRIAHRQHQHRNALAIALRHAAIGVFRPRPMLHAKGANLPAGGHPADRIGHMQPNALLPHHHRADINRRAAFDQMIDRIASEHLNALAAHDLRDRFAHLHDFSPNGRCIPPHQKARPGLPACATLLSPFPRAMTHP